MTAPHLLAVDIGNTFTKVALFDRPSAPPSGEAGQLPAPRLVRDFRTGDSPPQSLAAELAAELSAEHAAWRIASVNREGQRVLTQWLAEHRPHDEPRVLTCRDLPIAVEVDFPDKVGVDRLASAVAANVLREPGRPAIVVGAGSAVTVDLVSEEGAFQGGVILAGFRMQAEALFGGADLLPLASLVPSDEPPPVVGKNTEAAIRSGLFWGAVGAVREIVARMTAELAPLPHIFITGGDLARLAPLTSSRAQFVPWMVLSGIASASFGERAASASR